MGTFADIKDFYNTSEYQELKEYYSKDNIFSVLNKERNENVHSSFIAWLLKPQSSHGLRDYALRKLLRLYSTESKLNDNWEKIFIVGNYVLDNVQVETEYPINNKGEKGKMDIFLKADISTEDRANETESEHKLFLVIENKIYSNEHDNQTLKYHDYAKSLCDTDSVLVEIFLAPQKPESISASTFVAIDYKQLLTDVIEPLLNVNCITDLASTYINDYIRALGNPILGKDDKDNAKTKHYTLLAVSEYEKEKLEKIYKTTIYRSAYLANNELIKETIKTKFLNEWNINLEDVDNDRELLNSLWINNLNLFEAVALSNGLPLDEKQGENNRDNSKYIIKYNNVVKNFKNKNGSIRNASKGESACLIFKAWCEWYKNENGKEPSFKDLCQAFPLKINSYYNSGRWNANLFCKLEEEDRIFFNGERYKDSKERIENTGNKFDFFPVDEDHTFILRDNCRCLSLKMWRKADFESLLEWIGRKELSDFSENLDIKKV